MYLGLGADPIYVLGIVASMNCMNLLKDEAYEKILYPKKLKYVRLLIEGKHVDANNYLYELQFFEKILNIIYEESV
jgi:hypothetical protein